jgi:hypothetical protein
VLNRSFIFFQNVSLWGIWWIMNNMFKFWCSWFMLIWWLWYSFSRKNLKGWKTLNIFSCGSFKILFKFWFSYGIHSKWKLITRSPWFSNLGCCVGGKTFKILNAYVARIKRCFQILFDTCHFYHNVFNWYNKRPHSPWWWWVSLLKLYPLVIKAFHLDHYLIMCIGC